MSVSNALHRQYATIISRWPTDPLRPNLSFAETLSQRVQQYFGEANSTTPSQKNSAPPVGVKDAGKRIVKFDSTTAQREINALGNLLDDRFKKNYPLGENMLRPKGNPEYYENLMKELDSAPGRSWFQMKINSWKGWIRME